MLTDSVTKDGIEGPMRSSQSVLLKVYTPDYNTLLLILTSYLFTASSFHRRGHFKDGVTMSTAKVVNLKSE